MEEIEDGILIDEPLLFEPGPKRMVKVRFIRKEKIMKKDSRQEDYMNARIQESAKEEKDEYARLFQNEKDHVRKLINRLHRVSSFEERITNYDTGILIEITVSMKSYVKKIAKLRDDNETISNNWALLETLTSALFNELYRSDRDYISKWAILDEINDFFINFLSKDLNEYKGQPDYDINAVGTTILLMLRQTYIMNILKLYVDIRLREHLHDVEEVLIDDGIQYVAESENEFYAKVDQSFYTLLSDSKTIKKLIDNILEKIY